MNMCFAGEIQVKNDVISNWYIATHSPKWLKIFKGLSIPSVCMDVDLSYFGSVAVPWCNCFVKLISVYIKPERFLFNDLVI